MQQTIDLRKHRADASAATQRRRRASPKRLHWVRQPAGTRGGYDDLRRAATREPIGKGLRPSVASTADLARMLAALGREADMPKLLALRRLGADI